MSYASTRSDSEHRPASPCILVCTLDDDSVCLGCGRSLDEIVRWAGMSADEQWHIVRRAAEAPVYQVPKRNIGSGEY